jgi:organic radical activating enzyme
MAEDFALALPFPFHSVDAIGSRLRSVTININNRCPLRCRHCSIGFSSAFSGDDRRISIANLREAIAAVDPLFYDMILLAGGEPSLEIALLRVAIDTCKDAGLLSAIVTAPVWAPTSSATDRFLERVQGIDVIILSYDNYHLDFLTLEHYERAIRAAADRHILAVLQVCYTSDAELSELQDRLAGFSELFRLNATRTVPVGNAASPVNVTMGRIVVSDTADLTRIPRGCTAGNALIDEDRSVHGCCWARTAHGSPFTESAGTDELKAALQRLEDKPSFQSVRAHGFLDALTPAGQGALIQLIAGRSFANECDICIEAMARGGEAIWGQCRNPSDDNGGPPE